MITLMFAVFFSLILIRVPVGFAMIAGSATVILLDDGLPPVLVALRMYEGLTPFPILAVPLYYALGLLCNSSGITDRITTLAHALVGRVRAGLAMVNIVASMLFAGISGSSTADTAGIGAVIMPQMLKAGYPKPFTVAVTACSSTLGNIIPPSILMVIYGAFGNVSIGMLFLGGAIPGILLGLGQMVIVYFLARRFGFGVDDFGGRRPPVGRSLLNGALPMGVGAIVIAGIVFGVFTPTESAAVAVFYVVGLSVFIYREQSWRDMGRLLDEVGRLVGVIMILTASAAVFAWLLSYYRFPDAMVGLMEQFGIGRYGVLLAVVVVFLILGTFLDIVPSIIMFLPIIQALGDAAGIHPVQMGVVVVMTGALGMVTPPVGVCLMVAARLVGIHAREAVGITMLLALMSLAVILVSVFVPDLTLLLPRTLMARYF